MTARGRNSRRFFWTVAIAIAAAMGPVLLLYALNIPLGQPDKLIYRYSNLAVQRLSQVPPLGTLCALLGVGMWLSARRRAWHRVFGIGLGVLAVALMLMWNFWAAPGDLGIHSFNYTSPSQDGAFVHESDHVGNIPVYLRNFDRILSTKTEKLNSTRIISNTPGTTIYLRWIVQTWPPTLSPNLGWRERILAEEFHSPRAALPKQSMAVTAAMAMGALSVLAILPAYLLGRQFFSPAASLVFVVMVLFNPSTAHFFPGKDPAQLLTVCAMLWAGLAGYTRGSPSYSAIAGAILPIGMAFGLIHFWIALAVGIAVIWDAWRRDRLKACLMQTILPAAAGALVVMLIVYISIGWNMPLTFWRVQARFRQLQPELGFDRTLWLLIGLPLFLLFLGPLPYVLAALNARLATWKRFGLGQRILISALAVMLLTYVIGVSYELPRLWVVFIPLLALGMMIPRKAFTGHRAHRRVLIGMLIIVTAHVVATGLHWSLLDAREAEYRIRSGRMFQ